MKTITPKRLEAFFKKVRASIDIGVQLIAKLELRQQIIFQDMKNIKLNKNTKEPIKGRSWTDKRNQYNSIDTSKFNVGVPTGRVNNIIVVDIDIKKEHKKELDGVAKYDEYIEEHGQIDTLRVRTPSGGMHLYFKYDNTNEDIKYIIQTHLYTRQNVGGYSIDIRSNGGYIVAPPSSIDGGRYSSLNNKSINDIPLSFATFLRNIDNQREVERMENTTGG